MKAKIKTMQDLAAAFRKSIGSINYFAMLRKKQAQW